MTVGVRLRHLRASSVSTASLIRELRRETSAPVYAVKQALEATNYDREQALNHLARHGPFAAHPKRLATDGLIAIQQLSERTHSAISIVYVASETDFVARTPHFAALLNDISSHVLASAPSSPTPTEPAPQVAVLETEAVAAHPTVGSRLRAARTALGENLRLVRAGLLTVPAGAPAVLAHYLHARVHQNAGRIGVALALESDYTRQDELQRLGVRLAIHIAATGSRGEGRSLGRLSSEKESLEEEEFVGEGVEGKTVGEVMEEWSKERNTRVKFGEVLRFEVGEG